MRLFDVVRVGVLLGIAAFAFYYLPNLMNQAPEAARNAQYTLRHQ